MASEVNVHEAKTHLSRLLHRVEQGEEIVIARAGKPIARLVPIGVTSTPRVPGLYAGQIWIAEDFDEGTSQWLADLFEGNGDVDPD